ncbi:hypothetical protein ACIQU6_38415 [Streptomyces sp. NPDC090442]|uniref:hypothetical protein n=1 Tax=Streptomyces sp. NPDC090442 TaxID=3365962 RepID=UPI0037FD9EBF
MPDYTRNPAPHREAPATLWQWANELDAAAADIDVGRRVGALGCDGRPQPARRYRGTARAFRQSALTGALRLDGVPAMFEADCVLAPHMVSFGQSAGHLILKDAHNATVLTADLPDHLGGAVATLLRAVDGAVRACTFGPKRRYGRPAYTSERCRDCAAWADQYTAAFNKS